MGGRDDRPPIRRIEVGERKACRSRGRCESRKVSRVWGEFKKRSRLRWSFVSINLATLPTLGPQTPCPHPWLFELLTLPKYSYSPFQPTDSPNLLTFPNYWQSQTIDSFKVLTLVIPLTYLQCIYQPYTFSSKCLIAPSEPRLALLYSLGAF